MNPADPIIFTAYLLSIAYFIYKIIDSFNDEFAIELLKENNENGAPEEKDGGLKQVLKPTIFRTLLMLALTSTNGMSLQPSKTQHQHQ